MPKAFFEGRSCRFPLLVAVGDCEAEKKVEISEEEKKGRRVFWAAGDKLESC